MARFWCVSAWGVTRLGLFGNTGELRLDEAAAGDGGQFSGTFTIRAMLP